MFDDFWFIHFDATTTRTQKSIKEVRKAILFRVWFVTIVCYDNLLGIVL